MRITDIDVRCRGGFRGPYIDTSLLIAHAVILDILDFVIEKSSVKSCDNYCRMQIRLNGRLYVTWHSSALLTHYLEDCKALEAAENKPVFPIESCIILQGDDRGYYLEDSSKAQGQEPTDDLISRLINQSKNRGRR